MVYRSSRTLKNGNPDLKAPRNWFIPSNTVGWPDIGLLPDLISQGRVFKSRRDQFVKLQCNHPTPGQSWKNAGDIIFLYHIISSGFSNFDQEKITPARYSIFRMKYAITWLTESTKRCNSIKTIELRNSLALASLYLINSHNLLS